MGVGRPGRDLAQLGRGLLGRSPGVLSFCVCVCVSSVSVLILFLIFFSISFLVSFKF